MIGRCPHDWLFQYVSSVVHHGGAGTTAAGLVLGRPTVVVPFFGDQPFWGSIVARAGAGPQPLPYKSLTAAKLADALRQTYHPEMRSKAAEIGEMMRKERGVCNAACSFHRHLKLDRLCCDLCPDRPAVWWVKHSRIRLSTFAAAVLVETGLLKSHHFVLYVPFTSHPSGDRAQNLVTAPRNTTPRATPEALYPPARRSSTAS